MMVERATGYTVIKKLSARNKEQATTALLRALAGHRERIKTMTFDNGTEFHGNSPPSTVIAPRFARPQHLT